MRSVFYRLMPACHAGHSLFASHFITHVSPLCTLVVFISHFLHVFCVLCDFNFPSKTKVFRSRSACNFLLVCVCRWSGYKLSFLFRWCIWIAVFLFSLRIKPKSILRKMKSGQVQFNETHTQCSLPNAHTSFLVTHPTSDNTTYILVKQLITKKKCTEKNEKRKWWRDANSVADKRQSSALWFAQSWPLRS